jgi:uncharacterized membrane protein YgdD (TMEM256/DUF423 family)
MNLNPAWILAAALGGALSVALGAIASHVVADIGAAALLGTATQYGMTHAAALVGLAALAPRIEGFAARLLAIAAWLFIAGLVLFSGGLSMVALAGTDAVVRLVPIGGACYLLGWATLGIAGVKAWRATARPR